MQTLLTTITRALPNVLNVALVMLLLLYIYACAGVELFGKQGCEMSDCEGFSEHGNFVNWNYAMLMLFRLTTGDNGYGVLIDAMRTEPQCSAAIDCEHDCCTTGGPLIAILYFTSFQVFSRSSQMLCACPC